MANRFAQHVSAYHRAHPGLRGPALMRAAAQDYHGRSVRSNPSSKEWLLILAGGALLLNVGGVRDKLMSAVQPHTAALPAGR